MAGTFVHVPEVATTLVLRTTAEGRTDLIAVGPRTRGTYHPGKPLRRCLRMRLAPGRARRLLGVPIDELVNRVVPITDLWGAEGRRMTDRLAGAEDAEAVFAQLFSDPASAVSAGRSGRFVSGAVAGGRSKSVLDGHERSRWGSGLIDAAVRELAPPQPPRLGDVAARLGVSERHLRAVFAREVGLSPKHFARIARIRRVLSRAGSGAVWAVVADEVGYFDQAHLINDFRGVMGVTPAAYAAGRLPEPSPCAALHRLV